jgi:feruloyl esterase
VPSQASLDYWKAVVAHDGAAHVERYFRLFMVPGMAHCATASPGPNLLLQPENDAAEPLAPERDVLAALQSWVEDGQPPTHFAVRLKDDLRALTPRTILACAEPSVAKYNGEGDPLRAENWHCERP